MRLQYAPNKLNWSDDFLDLFDRVTTLIWWNGSWKSSILQRIFQEYIEEDDIKIVCFSSWQNELFSRIFEKHKYSNRRSARERRDEIKSFYFDKNWIRILIFFATALVGTWRTRKYLLDKNYITVANDKDTVSCLSFKLSVYKSYLDKIENEYQTESQWTFLENLYRNTIAHQYLDKLIIKKIDENYDFLDHPRKIHGRKILLKASEVNEVFGNNINEIFTFLFHATSYYEYSINSYAAELFFDRSIEFKDLSDGEYQILAFYAIIDLFDSENTLFLFDEIDSHLHYSNIKNLWDSFKQIRGNIITSTHNIESIVQNNFQSIRYIAWWKIDEEAKPKEIIKKIQTLSSQQDFEVQIAWRIEHIALLDDEIDWYIFKKLAIKKMWVWVIDILNKIVPIKRTSGFDTADEIFWKWKLLFAKELQEKSWESITKNIFLICDRDNLPINQINSDLTVNLHSDFRNLQRADFQTHLLSWKRREIENYLLYKELISTVPGFQHLNFDRLNVDTCEDIRIFDAKPLIKPLYKIPNFSEQRLDLHISRIPPAEISDDIEKMYNFISSKIS